MNLTLKTERSHSLFDSEVSVSFDQVTKVLAAHGHNQNSKEKIPKERKRGVCDLSQSDLSLLLNISNLNLLILLNLLKIF